jgi:hypothetical protein
MVPMAFITVRYITPGLVHGYIHNVKCRPIGRKGTRRIWDSTSVIHVVEARESMIAIYFEF